MLIIGFSLLFAYKHQSMLRVLSKMLLRRHFQLPKVSRFY